MTTLLKVAREKSGMTLYCGKYLKNLWPCNNFLSRGYQAVAYPWTIDQIFVHQGNLTVTLNAYPLPTKSTFSSTG